MPFPSHIDSILTAYGVAPDTKSALYDLYISMGDEVLDVFADMAESAGSPSSLQPEDTKGIRDLVVERYLTRNHPLWQRGEPTASLWHPREAEGRASGLAVPLGAISDTARAALPEGQSAPDGFVMLGRNAHYGGRSETISFDVVAEALDDAIRVGRAAGQQHTLPGSVGETSGTFDVIAGVALIWEVQPNVYKPRDDRNQAIGKIYRRHRNWHLLTLASALKWLRDQRCATFILRGSALATTHEVNPAKPISTMIADLHDRTVADVAVALGVELSELDDEDETLVLSSLVMNHALRLHVSRDGAAGAMWRVRWPGEGS